MRVRTEQTHPAGGHSFHNGACSIEHAAREDRSVARSKRSTRRVANPRRGSGHTPGARCRWSFGFDRDSARPKGKAGGRSENTAISPGGSGRIAQSLGSALCSPLTRKPKNSPRNIRKPKRTDNNKSALTDRWPNAEGRRSDRMPARTSLEKTRRARHDRSPWSKILPAAYRRRSAHYEISSESTAR